MQIDAFVLQFELSYAATNLSGGQNLRVLRAWEQQHKPFAVTNRHGRPVSGGCYNG